MLAVLLILIYVRPFISSLAFSHINLIYSVLFAGFLAVWITFKGVNLRQIWPLRYPLLLFVLALVISSIFSSNISASVKELYKYAASILLLCIVASLSNKAKNRVILCIALSGFAISLIAIYQYLFGFGHLANYVAQKNIADPFISDYIIRRRPFAPFVTPNALAGYLAMILPLGLMQKNKPWLIIPLSLALLLTKSLGALFSVSLGLILYFCLQGKLRKKGIFVICGILMITGLVLIFRASAQKLHTQPIFSAIMRLNYWRDTLSIIKLQPWTGVGPGNFNLAQSRYAHNSYLQLWAETGMLGLISFLWLIFAVFKSRFKLLKDSGHKKIPACLITACAIFLLHNLVDFTFFLPEVSLIWWVILGL